MSSESLTVALGDRTYDIFFGEGIYPLCQEWICRFYPGSAVFVVTDENVASLYGDDIRRWLTGIRHSVLPLPAGEESKTWETVREIYRFLARENADRDSLIVAFGGGVVGDLAGFAAATWLRGIPYLQVPTTLLSQVDSSVGGKTGFNLPEGKNLIGAFHQPRAVFIDHTFLHTLDDRNLRAGLAEAVKCALAGVPSLWELLETRRGNWHAMSGTERQAVIRQAVAFKAAVVERDERESSIRRVLNLGHTVGHALEQAAGYGRLLHGEAVAAGLAWELSFSRRVGVTPPEVERRAVALLGAMGFSLDDPALELPRISAAVGMDKKRAVTDLHLPLVTGFGKCALKRVPVELLRKELAGIRAELRGRTGEAEEETPEERELLERIGPGGTREALAILEERVASRPRDLGAMVLLAKAYRRAGNGTAAWETIKEALQQYPSDSRAQRVAREIEADLAKAPRGSAEGTSPPLEDMLLTEEGDFELRSLETPEAGPAEPASPAPAHKEAEAPAAPVRTITLANLYWEQGDHETARRIIDGILANDPADRRAREWKDAREESGIEAELSAFLTLIAKEYGHDLSGNP